MQHTLANQFFKQTALVILTVISFSACSDEEPELRNPIKIDETTESFTGLLTGKWIADKLEISNCPDSITTEKLIYAADGCLLISGEQACLSISFAADSTGQQIFDTESNRFVTNFIYTVDNTARTVTTIAEGESQLLSYDMDLLTIIPDEKIVCNYSFSLTKE